MDIITRADERLESNGLRKSEEPKNANWTFIIFLAS